MDGALLKDLICKVALTSDTQAYKKLFLFYYPRLLSFSYGFTHCKEASEEVVSDVFIKIWSNRSTLLRVSNFHLYIYVSTKNLSLNCVQKQKRDKTFSLDDVHTEFKSIYYDPEQLMISAEMFKRICLAIQSLPPRCRLIFKLIKEDGLSYKEVAELLHLSSKTIENQMTIALRKLGDAVALQKEAFLLS
ncbi:MAG TPA: RNA polymerase sigma-70 factor [Flavisolibacter sp.]|jgi:RNA polymerase sigma-70 factor (ECF subfamily)|nr:RNA polymerase sigma-70 factor [Flavisolibacter sp.]